MPRLNGQQRREQQRLRRERIRAEKEAFKTEQEEIRTRQEQAILDSAREEKFLQAKARADERKAINDARQLSDSKGGTDAPVPGGQLRYPYDTLSSLQDFITFTALVYKRKKISTQDMHYTTTHKRGALNVKSWDFSGRADNDYYTKENTIKGQTSIGITGGPDKNAKELGTTILPVPAAVVDANKANYNSGNMNNFVATAVQGAIGGMNADDPGEFFQELGKASTKALKTAAENPGAVQAKLASTALETLGGNIDTNQLLARTQGAIINPNMEMLFSGPSIRSFKFQFKFTPRFEREAREVKRIITFFKLNMAPKGGSLASGNTMLKNPNIFRLAYKGRCTNYLHKFKLCALTDMGVNYTGEGNWATYADGSPISLTMDLNFTEMTPIYSEDYPENPYTTPGVGY